MKRTALVLTILVLVIGQVIAQTKSTQKTTKKTITKKKTTAKVVPKSTPTSTPVPTPKLTPTPTNTPATATSPFELTGLEAEVLVEINKMRTNPQTYVKIFEELLKTNNGNEFTDEGVRYISSEGKVPVEELIGAMKQLAPLPEFKASNGLTKAAKDHALDLVKNNKSGHTGSDGSQPFQRAAKYGFGNRINENISYFTNTARRIVMTMLIDDGTPSRAHRENMLSKNMRLIGIATGENKEVKNFCVVVFSDSFIETKSRVR